MNKPCHDILALALALAFPDFQDYTLLDELPIMRQLVFAAPAPDIVGRDIDRTAASMLSYFDIRYLTLHSTGGALRYGTMLRIASAAAGAPSHIATWLGAPDAFGGSELRRSFTAQNELPAGTVLIYTVAPPANPVPFLGVGAGWDAPVPEESH